MVFFFCNTIKNDSCVWSTNELSITRFLSDRDEFQTFHRLVNSERFSNTTLRKILYVLFSERFVNNGGTFLDIGTLTV